MANEKTVKVKTEDWNDLLKASAKKEPVVKRIEVKNAEPIPGVLVRTKVIGTKSTDGISIAEINYGDSIYFAVENVKEHLKDTTLDVVDVWYASTYEEAVQ